MTDFAPRQSCDMDKAIKELEVALPLVWLQNVIKQRENEHKPRRVLRRKFVRIMEMKLRGELA